MQESTAPIGGGTTTAGGTTVYLEPQQLQVLVDHQAANTYAVMLGLGMVLLFLSALVLMEVVKGRGW